MYWSIFVVAFMAIAIWESARPKRLLTMDTGRRWAMQGTMLLISSVIGTVLIRMSPVVAALAASKTSWSIGLANQAWLPLWIRFVATILLWDLVKYGTHRLYHAVPLLWRFHQVHHSDPDFDVGTTNRVHPVEFILNQISALTLIFVLAPPAVAVLAAELLGVAFGFFEHANASLPAGLEAIARKWVITPDLHRIHHSVRMEEQWTNLGEVFPCWDRVFGTYREEAMGGNNKLEVGLEGCQNERSLELGFMLTQPFQPLREGSNSPEPHR